MSESAGAVLWRRAKDAYVLALGVWIVMSLGISHLPLLPSDQRVLYSQYFSLLPPTFLVLFLLGKKVHEATRREERLFWFWILLCHALFLFVLIGGAVFRDASNYGARGLLIGALALSGELCMLIAAEQGADPDADSSGRTAIGRIRTAIYWFFGLVLFIYFQLIPAKLGDMHQVHWVPTWVAYLSLDAAISFRFLMLWLNCTSQRWKSIYALISISFALWVLSDFISVLGTARLLHIAYATWTDIFFYLPSIPLFLAVRYPSGEAAGPPSGGQDFRAMAQERSGPSPSSFLLFLLPTMHIVLAILNPMPDRVQAARGILVAAAMTVLYLLTVSERKLLNRLRLLADEKRGEAERMFELLFENAPEACYMIDLQGNFIDGNRAAEELVGYAREELIGKNFATRGLVASEYLCKVGQMFARTNMGLSIEKSEELVIIRKDGSHVSVEITAFPAKLNDRIVVLGIARDISERKRLQEEARTLNERLEARLAERTTELRKAEARYRVLVEQSLVGIYLLEGADSRVTYINPQAAKIFGYTVEELLGTKVLDLIVDEDKAIVAENLRRRMEGEVPSVRYTFRGRHKSGEVLDLEVHGVRTDFTGQPAILGVFLDITERKRTERALLAAEEKYREIFDNAVLGIFQTTPAGRYISANQAIARMYGYSSPEDLMATVTDIERQEYVDPSRRHELARLLAEQGVVHDFVFEIRRKDRSHAWISENSRLIRDCNGNPLYYEGTQEDITERKLLESQLLQAQKLEAVGHLAGGIAHDFNNILNIIMGYAELLLLPTTPQSLLQKNLYNILEASKRGAALSQQLLAFSSKHALQLRVIDLNETLVEVREMLSRVIGEDVELITKTHLPSAPIKADPNQLERLLINLAINAREAMPQGGRLLMEISQADGEKLQLLPEPNWDAPGVVQLTVNDTGCGMDADTLSHIFEPFFTTKQRDKGTGLGLAQVYGIVKQCGGNISVNSKPGEGTTFQICFPLLEALPEARQPAALPRSMKGAGTILLVEDEALLRKAIQIFLEGSGYKVLEAENPVRALEIAGILGEPIDLLVTDVIMPGMNGRQLVDAMLAKHPRLKVIYISGYNDEKIADIGIRDSEMTLLQKPFQFEDLALRIQEMIGASEVA